MNGLDGLRFAMMPALATAAALSTGCATIDNIAGARPRPVAVVVAPARLNPAEQAFVAAAMARNAYEIEVSRLASERATNPRVRTYAQQLVNTQSSANNELTRIMSARGIAPAKGLTADKASKLRRLASLPRSAAFDEGYVRVVGIEDHTANIALFEKARREAADRDLLAWIDRSLDAMRRQLGVAQSLAGMIAG
ncbi:MAG: DUF4142 domain-containing protein [Ramlibacter sp.]